MIFYNFQCKNLRAKYGWSQEKLVEKMGTGIKRETISQYETGKTRPDVETLVAMADAFGVSIDYLLGRANCEVISNEEVNRRIGLSEEAINTLLNTRFHRATYAVDLCDEFVKNESLWTSLSGYIDFLSDYNIPDPDYYNDTPYIKAGISYECSRLFANFVEALVNDIMKKAKEKEMRKNGKH